MSQFYSIEDVLSFAIQLEQASQEFYQQLTQTVHSPSVKRFLLSLVTEESLHEQRLQQLLKELGDAPKPWIAAEEVDAYVQAMDVSDSLDYKEAVKLAMEKEKAAEMLYRVIAGTMDDETLKDVFWQLAAQEKSHRDYFEDLYHTICISEN